MKDTILAKGTNNTIAYKRTSKFGVMYFMIMDGDAFHYDSKKDLMKAFSIYATN